MGTIPPSWKDYLTQQRLSALILAARDEDLGPRGEDVTSEVLVPSSLAASARLVSREPGVLAGLALWPAIAAAYDRSLSISIAAADGERIEPGQVVAVVSGRLRSILSFERVALNLVCHLSGVATMTRRYVDLTAGTRAHVYDTRKTLPGLRALQKYAVACGGGANHRMGLYDAVLIKDNHLAHLPVGQWPAAISDAMRLAKDRAVPPRCFEVEVDSLAQLAAVLNCGPDIVLLDNMTPATLREAVALRDREAPQVELEASGGVSLETIAAIAATGVERISVGALTHSARALDLGLDIP